MGGELKADRFDGDVERAGRQREPELTMEIGHGRDGRSSEDRRGGHRGTGNRRAARVEHGGVIRRLGAQRDRLGEGGDEDSEHQNGKSTREHQGLQIESETESYFQRLIRPIRSGQAMKARGAPGR